MLISQTSDPLGQQEGLTEHPPPLVPNECSVCACKLWVCIYGSVEDYGVIKIVGGGGVQTEHGNAPHADDRVS